MVAIPDRCSNFGQFMGFGQSSLVKGNVGYWVGMPAFIYGEGISHSVIRAKWVDIEGVLGSQAQVAEKSRMLRSRCEHGLPSDFLESEMSLGPRT